MTPGLFVTAVLAAFSQVGLGVLPLCPRHPVAFFQPRGLRQALASYGLQAAFPHSLFL